ncbi:hypothetical protein BJV78DRAFT_1135488, partial [Lactifluus subvellereus]
PAFREPYCFSSLSILLLEGIPLQDDDLLYIHHLPNLSKLNLNSTGICDVGVFHLVALRRTLTTLMLRDNPLITNDAVPALLLLSCLQVLGLRGTAVSMTGLRRLTPFSKHLSLDVPTKCELYLVELHTQYLLSPLPPLISHPEEARILELPALKRNLSAHAAHNPAISTMGSKVMLCARLAELLQRRRDDLAVRMMV